MPIEFDPVNKLIKITSPTTSLAAQDLYNAAMEWSDDLNNFIYDSPVDANGKFELGVGVYSDIIYRLLKGWKLKWYNGNKTVQIAGTLITDDGTSRTVAPDSGSIETVIQVASYGVIEQTDVSVNGTVTDASPLVGEFDGNSGLASGDDFYNGSILVFTSGSLKGIARKISDYIGNARTFRFTGGNNSADAPFPQSPVNGDKFRIIGRMV